MLIFKRNQLSIIRDHVKNDIYLFVYGTLMNPKSREHVLKHIEAGEKASVIAKKESYTTPEGKRFKTITPGGDKEVVGDLLQLDLDDLSNLTTWEDEYHLITITLTDGRKVLAFQLDKNKELKKEKANGEKR